MIYLERGDIVVRELRESDIEPIVAGEIAQGWEGATREKYDMRLQHEAKGQCIPLCATYKGEPVGYVNLYFKAYPPMDRFNCPEIVDFGVLEKYRRRGIGSALMDEAERLAARQSDVVCLGVGLYCSYGSAQRMYIKRGYIPDGSGAWYGDKPADPYCDYCLDDDLVLYFSKKLPESRSLPLP